MLRRLLPVAVWLVSAAVRAAPVDPALFQDLRWRCIGPHRGGRTVSAVGIPAEPNVFYIGVNNGGVWKTTDAGRIWKPVFDQQPTGSIGAIAIAPSDPNVVYVGSGEGLQRPDLSTGDGIYKSVDAGRTWRHLGLRDGQQIGAIVVDPNDPNRLFVAVLGHPYGANPERGVYRSTDGGETFERVLYKDEDTGAIALAFDPATPQIVYAVLWSARLAPWENGHWSGPGSGLFKSIDGGTTWRPLTQGLPTFDQGLGRIGLCVAPSDSRRLYATVEASAERGGIYRSDDGGENWRRVNADARLWSRGSDFAEVQVHPDNPDILFDINIVAWKSTDGGATFDAFRGAPGGDDPHRLWINPLHPEIMLLAGDQGAIVTVNGGETWSSWYNQPTAQFYHVSTDNQFPYWVYGGQQESGSVGIASRGNDGQITFRDWHPVGAEEYGYIAPDPLNPNLVYGGKITRFDRTTGQVQNIAPEAIRSGRYRFLRTAPVLFSPVDPHVLYYAGNVLFKTANGGHSWDIISPDLSRAQLEVPANIGVFRTADLEHMARRGVIYTVAPSGRDRGTLWAGTDDGLIHVTHDGGKTWTNVTPPEITPWSKVSLIDAGHFDVETAYAAVNRIRLDDQRAHVMRTHDGGKTWREIVAGLPDKPVNAVREDPKQPGLLFCGTERAVYVSFDDGDHWQSLRQNMPATSIRDLVIKADDIVVGTHGRSFWILDDITPLRQLPANVSAAKALLFAPQTAIRVRWNMNSDTPLPQEEPGGQNPPDGAILDYALSAKPAGAVRLEVLDARGVLVRRYSSDDRFESIDSLAKQVNIPTYWIRPPQIVSTAPGMHRLVWDLHHAPCDWLPPQYPIAAIYQDTWREPQGPWALPGTYTVRLSVDGREFTQQLVLEMDPRVKTPKGGIARQHAIAMQCYAGLQRLCDALSVVRKVRSQLQEIAQRQTAPVALNSTPAASTAADSSLAGASAALDKKLAALQSESAPPRTGAGAGGAPAVGLLRAAFEAPTLGDVNAQELALMDLVESVDAEPTTQAIATAKDLVGREALALGRWRALAAADVQALSARLARAGLPALVVEPEGPK